MKLSKSLFMILLAFTVTITGMSVFPGDAGAVIDRSYSEPVDLGAPVQLVSIFDSAYGTENGHAVMYTTASGSPGSGTPAVLNVIDLVTHELLRSFPLPGVSDSWSHITLPDGTVYVGTAPNGKLFRYSPETKQVEDLGSFSGQRQLYGLSFDEAGNVYGGTYPGGKVFKFDPDTGDFTDYGQMVDKQEYVRSTAYYDGHLYAGIGTQGGIVKLNVETGEKTEMPMPEVPGVDQFNTISGLDVAGQYLFANLNGNLAIYDMVAQQWTDKVFPNYKGLRLAQGQDGSDKVYFAQDGKLMELDLTSLDAIDTGVRYGTYLRNSAWVEVEGDPELPGLSLVTVSYFGGAVFMNPETNVTKSFSMSLEGQPVPIRTLEKGPDGAMYMSGYPGGKGAKYDPATGATTQFNLGQAEGMTPLGDKLYMGIYSGAKIVELDVTKPFEQGVNPKELFSIEGEDRPFAMTTGGGKIYIGTIPDYGELGGALTVYEPETEEYQIFHDVIYNQSIVGLAYKDGKLYGSTSVDGGEGINPTEKAAKMFVWDLSTNEKIAEFIPELPGAETVPDMISGLAFGPDGLLWGAADGTVFALDPETYEVVKSKVIYEGVSHYGKWRPVSLDFSEDGMLYTTVAGKLTVVDPGTLEHVTLANSVLSAIGDDGNIYYRSEGGTHLKMIEVSDGVTLPEVNIPIPLENPGFEQPVEEGDIPGWQLLYKTENTSFEISDEQSKSGDYSLKLHDPGQSETVAVASDNIQVNPGVTYTVNFDLFLQEGRTIFSMVFYNEDGAEMDRGSAQITSGRGQWQHVEFNAVAPDDAAYAKLVPFVSQYWMATAYYDDVRLSYKSDNELKSVTLATDQTTPSPGGTSALHLSAEMRDGTDAPLNFAQVTYHSNHSDRVAIDKDGQLTLASQVEDMRSFEVWADVTLDGVTVSSNVLEFDVDVSARLMLDTLAYYQDEQVSEDAYRALHVHLTAVGHYEKQGASDKIVKHLKGFKQLLDHQKEGELISEKAYSLFKADADSLIKNWQ